MGQPVNASGAPTPASRSAVAGLLVVDKPPGVGSTAVVARVKGLLRRPGVKPPKVGHAGTLDTFATGVLIVLIGTATKKCEAVMSLGKGYDATFCLGATTVTLDPDSQVIPADPPPTPPSLEAVRSALGPMMGEVSQVPPVFSALKIKGKRSSDRARAGEAVAPKPRVVRIDALEVLDYEWPTLRLRVVCGRGTYVRSIARDLGAALGVGAYLTALRRTRVGPYLAEDAVTLEQLGAEGVEPFLVSGPGDESSRS